MKTLNSNQKSVFRRRMWWAVFETLSDRSITPISIQRPRQPRTHNGIIVDRFAPYWSKIPQEDLIELFHHLLPYFKQDTRHAKYTRWQDDTD